MTATGYYKTIRNVKVYGKHIYIMGQDPFIMRTEHGAADVDYVGVEESSLASAERVKVYPNPIQSNGVLTIDGVENEDSELILFNAVGKVVLNTSLKGNQVELSEFDLTDGVYFYRLTSASSSVSGKLVIK
jgi:hypothetical protein